MSHVKIIMIIIVLFIIIVSSLSENYAHREARVSDEKLSEEVSKLGDELYFACLKEAEYINNALAKNQSVENVPMVDITDEDVIFWLYTRKNPTIPQNLSATDATAVTDSNFNPSKLIVFYIPGARDAANESAKQLSSKILPAIDANVIVTNWDSYSFYNGSFVVNRTVPLLANICVKLIRRLIQAGATPNQLYVIGFSAGGQTAGFIGKQIKNIARILAIDPGARCYTYQPPHKRLTADDAQSVQILHCTAGVLGVPPSYQVTADFYYYGGIFQTRCRYPDSPYRTGTCSHTLCKYFFFDSLTNSNVSLGVKCDNYEQYVRRNCTSRRAEVAGFYSDSKLRGLYFIEKLPFQANFNSVLDEWF